MAFATSTSTPIRRCLTGSQWPCEPCDASNKQRLYWVVENRPDHDILLEEGEFQVTCRERGIRRIGRLTGRTRKFAAWDFAKGYSTKVAFPTVELYDVDTVVEMVGDLPVIVGRRGERLKIGTWRVSPCALA